MQWYAENKREFPWRNTKDPYKIWLSEIILQQTQVQQGLPYYLRFVTTYPRVEDLAEAAEEDVLKLWQGLGYYSRARNLLFSAHWVVNKNKGIFPKTFKGLMQLKGVGDYTASAIASICYDEFQAVVDGNVYRFLSRYFGITTPIDSSIAHREFKARAMALMKGESPGEFNQALMEFGALQCTPKQPQCQRCPFLSSCLAYEQGKVASLPIKAKQVKTRKRFFNYLVLDLPSAKTILRKRAKKGIWQNLYEFPLIESPSLLNRKELMAQKDFAQWQTPVFSLPHLITPQPIKHLLSHQHLFIQFWHIKGQEEIKNALAQKELKNYPVPVVIQHFIDQHFFD